MGPLVVLRDDPSRGIHGKNQVVLDKSQGLEVETNFSSTSGQRGTISLDFTFYRTTYKTAGTAKRRVSRWKPHKTLPLVG